MTVKETNQKSYKRNREKRLVYVKAYRLNNKEKIAAGKKRYYQENRDRILAEQKQVYEKRRERDLKKQYNITLKEYNEILCKQNDVCGICHKPETRPTSKNLVVDHCHKTGKVRGLLCSKCNAALGFFQENINNLQNAIKYLAITQEETDIKNE